MRTYRKRQRPREDRVEQTGIVRETRDGIAVVEVIRKSACAGCEKSGLCGGVDGGCPTVTLEAENQAGAQTDDQVSIYFPSRCVLGYAAAVFFLPPVICLLFYFLGWYFWKTVGASIACSAAALLFYLLFLRTVMEKRAKRMRYVVRQIKYKMII